MKKTDAHQPFKRPRLVSRLGSTVLTSGASAAVIQLPSNVGGPVDVRGLTQANAITLEDSLDDDNGGASVSTVNNGIVSFYLLLFSCMYMDV